MNIGVVFPQNEIGTDMQAMRTYATGVEDLGFTHVLAYDHVLGADPDFHPGWSGLYDVDAPFHEPFVLFGFLAACTSMEVATAILILPQRQTVLVAKQAAEVDILTGGRFRLGVGVGWNTVEYQALGKEFSDRGARLDEQVELLRRLWTTRSTTFSGRFEQVDGAGLAPMPLRRPIPVWFGGRTAPAYRRIGRSGDGWFPMVRPGDELTAAKRAVENAARAAGRDPSRIGMEGRIRLRDGEIDFIVASAERWRDAGATHVAIDTMAANLNSVEQHLDVLATVAGRLRKTLGGLGS
jgi:probable F420-dependent oxidoreductase